MNHEIQSTLNIGMHQPEHLLQATQHMCDANVQQLAQLAKIRRGRELRHALQAELHGEKAGANALHAQFTQLLQHLQPNQAPDAGTVTNPQKARARRIIFLLRLENQALRQAAEAALADVTTARAGKRLMDQGMRAAIIVALARVATRLGMLADYCDKVQHLADDTAPATHTEEQDEDDL